MNVFFIASHLIDSPISKIRSMASYSKLDIGDLLVLRMDRRLVLIIVNQFMDDKKRLTEYPMVAQVICDDDNMPKLLPILYFDDGFSKRICDISGLESLLDIFKSEKVAYDILFETRLLSLGKIYYRDANLMCHLLNDYSTKPPCKVLYSKKVGLCKQSPLNQNEGKLLIVEKYLNPKMKQAFYDNITLGFSERESLVMLRRKYPEIFSKILKDFKDKDIYTRL